MPVIAAPESGAAGTTERPEPTTYIAAKRPIWSPLNAVLRAPEIVGARPQPAEGHPEHCRAAKLEGRIWTGDGSAIAPAAGAICD